MKLFSILYNKIGTRGLIVFAVLVVVFGGAGGIIFDRLVLPRLAQLPGFDRLHLQDNPVVITRREEVRIDEGINNTEIINQLRSSLAVVYIHTGSFRQPGYQIKNVVSGAAVSVDGVIMAPAVTLEKGAAFTVVLADSKNYPGRLIGYDKFSGLMFIKIEAGNLSVIRTSTGSTPLQAGEKLLAITAREDNNGGTGRPVTLMSSPAAQAGFESVYTLDRLGAFLQLDHSSETTEKGAVIADRNGSVAGFVAQIDGKNVVLRASDLRLAIDNFFSDGSFSWPKLSVAYRILSSAQTSLVGLPKGYGVLVQTSAGEFKAGDFIYSVDGRELSSDYEFQQAVFSKKPGTTVRFGVIRNSKEQLIEAKI